MFIKSIIPLLLLCFLVVCTSCENEGNSDNSSDDNQTQLEMSAQAGTWHISSFIDSDRDETNHFTGYNFTFGPTGNITATKGGTSYTGSWSVTDSNSNDDSLDDLHFNIKFNLTNDFEDLNDDWDIIRQSSTKIELIDVSGGNGGTDYLTFVKN